MCKIFLCLNTGDRVPLKKSSLPLEGKKTGGGGEWKSFSAASNSPPPPPLFFGARKPPAGSLTMGSVTQGHSLSGVAVFGMGFLLYQRNLGDTNARILVFLRCLGL